MYGEEDEEKSSSQPRKPGRKKTVKLNRPATFFELGDRKTKWYGEVHASARTVRMLQSACLAVRCSCLLRRLLLLERRESARERAKRKESEKKRREAMLCA